MSFLDSVKQGHVLSGNGMYELPSAEEVVTKIKKNLLPHQEKFCNDTEHRKLALVCGFGAGKTYALVSKSFMLAAMNVGHISAVFEPTSPMLRDILMRTMNDLLEEWEIPYTFRASPLPEYVLSFQEGTHTILLRTILTYQRLRGQNLCAVGFDEADTVNKRDAEQAMNMALARLRSGNVQQFYATTTPEGHSWAFGAGKTYALVSKSFMLAAMNVGHISAVFEPTSPMLRDILMRTMNDLLEEWEIPYTFRASPLPEYVLSFQEGTHTILLRTILTYQRLRGQNLCAVGFDEADTVNKRDAEQAMNMALARLRSGNVQQFYATTTPEGHSWIVTGKR